MLDGCYKESVIVGQNWGSSPLIEEEDLQRRHHEDKPVAMVDMIQAAHQQYPHKGFFGLAPGSSSPGGGGGDEFDRYVLASASSSASQQWRESPNPLLKYYGANLSSRDDGDEQQVEARRERVEWTRKTGKSQSEMDLSSGDCKILFPRSSSVSNCTLLHYESIDSIDPQRKKKKSKLVDGDDLLSLRPPNSALSDITATTTTTTTTSSSLDHRRLDRADGLDHHHLQQQQQQQRPLGMDLLNTLLECAQAVNRHDLDSAIDLLAQLKHGASIYGDSMQRLTAHFAEGLATRILSSRSPSAAFLSATRLDLLHSLIIQRSGGGGDDYLAAFTALYTVSPFFKLAHFTANQAILEAVAGRSRIHVLDLDILQGFQWPSFIQALASRPGGPPSLLTLTGVGSSAESLRETGDRLSSFAATFGVPFLFRPLVAGSLEEVEGLLGAGFEPGSGRVAGGATGGDACHLGHEDEYEQHEEVVAVNAVFQLHRLLNTAARPPGWRKLERFLAGLRRMRPVAVALVEQEAAHNAPDFIGRFVEALHYYAAVFDSLDASLPQRNEERVRIEQLVFAAQVRNIVSCEGEARLERHEKMEFWKARMADCGFVQTPMSSHSISQAKLLLQLCPCDGYRLVESPCQGWPVGAISLAWQQRLLLTASTWACG